VREVLGKLSNRANLTAIFGILFNLTTSKLLQKENPASFLYTRHTGMPTVNEATFLNSGCMLGRIGQMKKMFRYAKKYALSIRDDQQIFVRYLLQHSDEVGLDMASALFLTTHKQSSSSTAFQWLPDLDFMFRNRQQATNSPTDCTHFIVVN
jgi:hypothetical protein